MFERLRTYFNAQSTRHHVRRALKQKISALHDAIRHYDAETVTALYDEVRGNELFTTKMKERLFREALRRDDADIFAALLNKEANPNYMFTKAYPAIHPRGAMVIEKEHILHAAIMNGSQNIALMLAQDARVSINKAGSSTMTPGYYTGGSSFSRFCDLGAMAGQKGMPQVAAALTRREASRSVKSNIFNIL